MVYSEKKIILTLDRINKELRALRQDVNLLKESDSPRLAELRGMLRRRGLILYRENPVQHLFFSPAYDKKEQFYELCKKYSFRLFLREILTAKGQFRIPGVARFYSAETGRKYIRSLITMGLAESLGGNQYRLSGECPTSIGPTLEWFMAEILRREFSCPTLYGLRCKGTRFGGDYDVIASLEGRLLYLEVKSSPPKNIEGAEVHEFFSRLQDLIPRIALFFVDTELRLKDKIVPLFEAERQFQKSQGNGLGPPIQKIADEIFFAPPQIYILGSKRSITRNLALCFQHHFTFPGLEYEGREFLGG